MDTEERNSAFLLGSTHFFVDFACTALLTAYAAELSAFWILACALIYNGLAFAFQLPIGALADRLSLNRVLAALGCLLVFAGALFSLPLAGCIFIGLGNACFHVGGGREALKGGKGKASLVGKFVAPGAIGIFLGPKAAGFFWLARILLPACLLIFAVLLFTQKQTGEKAERQSLPGMPLTKGTLFLVFACMFFTVLLRSYMGTVLRYPFLKQPWPALLFTLCIFGGKYWGGSLADRFGPLRFSVAAQLLASLLFVLSLWIPLLALPGIFLFNTTMAITAHQLYRALPQYPGTMFGMTTFALYLGILPRLLGWENGLFNWWGLGILSLCSTAFLVAGLLLMKGGQVSETASAVLSSVSGTDAAP